MYKHLAVYYRNYDLRAEVILTTKKSMNEFCTDSSRAKILNLFSRTWGKLFDSLRQIQIPIILKIQNLIDIFKKTFENYQILRRGGIEG